MKIYQTSMPNIMASKYNKQDKTNFGYRLNMHAELEIYPNTRQSFINDVTNAIISFPNKYKSFLQNHGYTITIAPSLNTALVMRGIATPASLLYEKNYPKNSLHTAINNANNKNIIIADKQPYSNNYTKNIVYYALSSAIVETAKLYNRKDILKAIHNDITHFNISGKFDFLNKNEKTLLTKELLDSNGKIKILEVLPDLIAWNLGAGKYGSGLYNVHNPYFTRNLFPETSRVLAELIK